MAGRDAEPAPMTVLFLLKRVDCHDGVAAYLETLIEGLKLRGDRALIVSGPVRVPSGAQARHDRLRQAAVDWIVLPRLAATAALPVQAARLAALVRRHRVDVISAQGMTVLPLATVVRKLTGVPVAATRHTVVSDGRARAGALLRVFARLFRADASIAISQEMAEVFRAVYRMPAQTVHVIANGVDTRAFRPPSDAERSAARAALDIGPDRLVCALVGRLDHEKGHDVLVDAVRLLHRRATGPRIVCLFAGEGDGGGAIRAFAHHDEADGETFRFLGFQDAERLRRVYHAADLFVLPSRNDGFALAVAEAMACGCVPIRTRTGGAYEQIVEGVTGFTIDMDDAQGLAARIAELADPALCRAMSASAARHAAGFSRETMIERTAALYRNLAGRRAP